MSLLIYDRVLNPGVAKRLAGWPAISVPDELAAFRFTSDFPHQLLKSRPGAGGDQNLDLGCSLNNVVHGFEVKILDMSTEGCPEAVCGNEGFGPMNAWILQA